MSSFRNVGELRSIKAEIVHMQYPSTGYGWKLGPQMMMLLQPMVLTLHEASQAHIIRRLSLYPFTIRAQRVIFTNEFERAYVSRLAPWIASRSSLIPIGSNVTPLAYPVTKLKRTVTYFGLIRSGKGLEQVIELAGLLHRHAPHWKTRIIGKLMPGFEALYQNLRERSQGLNIDWQVGLDEEALSIALAATDVAYLPFPDGASERRGSLLALLTNSAVIITTRGPHTPLQLREAVLFAASPLEAMSHIKSMDACPERNYLISLRARKYGRNFQWERIADMHLAIYRQCLISK